MLVLSIYITCAVVAGIIAFFSPPRQLPRWWLALACAALPQLAHILWGFSSPVLFAVSIVAFVLWALGNIAIPGMRCIVVGVSLNLMAMAFYSGAMPIQADILTQLGYNVTPGMAIPGSKNVVVADTPLWMLSDWIVIPAGRTVIASLGDLIVMAGVLWWLLADSLRQRQGRSR